MLPKKNRFTTKLFNKKFRKSRRFGTKDVTFLVSDGFGNDHFSVVVGKKTSKLAVKRNRLKRQLYSVVREELYGRIGNRDVICLYKGNEKIQNMEDIKESVNKFLKFLKK